MNNPNHVLWKPFEFVIKWPIYTDPTYTQKKEIAVNVSTVAIFKALKTSMRT